MPLPPHNTQFTNRRPTFNNIKLITTAVVLNKTYGLSGHEIVHGINAYLLIARETKSDFMEINYDKVQRALRVSTHHILTLQLLNKTISFKTFLGWFIKMKPHLELEKEERKVFDRLLKEKEEDYERENHIQLSVTFANPANKSQAKSKPAQAMSLISGGGTNQTEKMFSGENGEVMKQMEGVHMMQHEFLYLLCNATDRVEIIEEHPKVDLHSEKGKIYHWELKDGVSAEDKISHIHLLSQNAFRNRAPHHLVCENLERATEEMNLHARRPEKLEAATRLKTFFNNDLDSKIEQSAKKHREPDRSHPQKKQQAATAVPPQLKPPPSMANNTTPRKMSQKQPSVVTVGPVCIRPTHKHKAFFNDPKMQQMGAQNVREYIK